MSDDEAESTRLSLCRVLNDAEAHLRRYAIGHWAYVLPRSRAMIEERDFRGVASLWSVFGGMGSFNDVTIHPLNGNPVADTDVEAVTQRLRELQGTIYEFVHALRHYEYARPAPEAE